MAKTLKADLTVSGLNDLANQIRDYGRELAEKCEEYVKRLAESGIEVAQKNTGKFGKYITFSTDVDADKDGCTALVLMTNTGIIKSEWMTKDGMKSADVSPILMVEFGSGRKAQNPKKIPGVGTGTFPGGTHGNEPGWWYMDLNGAWHYSTGITPQQPMYKASLKIAENAARIAHKVFGK